MTLADVNRSYPVDNVVNYFLQHALDWNFGEVLVDRFTFDDGTLEGAPTTTALSTQTTNAKIQKYHPRLPRRQKSDDW
jgi:hypothetical protein